MMRPDARYACWGATLVLLAAMPAFAGFAGLGWELAQIAGLLGAIGCAALCGAPLRPRDARPPTLLTLRSHTLIGWLALLAVLAHAVGLLAADRKVIEYLKPTAPLHQLAGILAAVLLLLVVVSSTARARRRLWRSHRGFQAAHVILGCALLGLAAVHVIGTQRYAGGRPGRLLWVAAAIGSLLLLLRYRRPGRPDPAAASRIPKLVFGRHSTVVLAFIAAIAVALAALSLRSAIGAVRTPLMTRQSMLPLDFPHAKHVAVNCLECHHNYEEGDFSNTCVACHRSSRADLKMAAEPRFHGFCLECHRRPKATFEHRGPVAGCSVCHQPPSEGQSR
jgi:hypothetical protein